MPQGSRAEKEYKRRAVVLAKLAGQGTRATARQIGCSERYVRRLAAETETRFLITEILRPYHATLNQLVARVIKVIEDALGAMKTDDADHLTRLRAVERCCELLEMAQGKLPEEGNDNASREMTWEEFAQLYQARQERTRDEEDGRR
jgi:hypothetical protein